MCIVIKMIVVLELIELHVVTAESSQAHATLPVDLIGDFLPACELGSSLDVILTNASLPDS